MNDFERNSLISPQKTIPLSGVTTVEAQYEMTQFAKL